MNFTITGKGSFVAGIDKHSRNFYATYKRNGKIKIVNFLNGQTLFDDLEENEILINNQPFSNLDNLQNILFNRECICDSNIDDGKLKIFDGSFDSTFE